LAGGVFYAALPCCLNLQPEDNTARLPWLAWQAASFLPLCLAACYVLVKFFYTSLEPRSTAGGCIALHCAACRAASGRCVMSEANFTPAWPT